VTLLERVADALERAGIPFALIGASALAVHGVSRSTLDQDLLATDPRSLDPEVWRALSGDVGVDVRHGDADDPLAGVVRFALPGERDVDLVVGRGGWQAAVVARAVRIDTGSGTLPVAGAADLVLLKLYAGGAQDLWDIEQLLAADTGRTLTRDVESRLPSLPARCRDLWDRSFGGRG
jgi:hypothetical protein